ncbi:MAG: hypothetical protein WB561_13740 [Terracidiphilus sp.]
MLSLGHLVNRRIMVSLPDLLGTSDPLTCVLISNEVAGIWISSPELAEKLCPPQPAGDTPPIFIPFTQIGFVVSAESSQPPPARKTSAAARPHQSSKSHISDRKRR